MVGGGWGVVGGGWWVLGAGCWVLGAGCWVLGAGAGGWVLVAGGWCLVPGAWWLVVPGAGCRLPAVAGGCRCRLPVAGLPVAGLPVAGWWLVVGGVGGCGGGGGGVVAVAVAVAVAVDAVVAVVAVVAVNVAIDGSRVDNLGFTPITIAYSSSCQRYLSSFSYITHVYILKCWDYSFARLKIGSASSRSDPSTN